MTPTDLHPIIHQAERNQAAGWDWCLLRPAQVIELADANVRLLDALDRLAQIQALCPPALASWADHGRDAVLDALHDIERLSCVKRT